MKKNDGYGRNEKSQKKSDESSGAYGPIRKKACLSVCARQVFQQKAAEDAMNYVRSYGYIDDNRYAFHYISCRIHSKSRQKIMEELYRKGIERNVAECAWERAKEIEEPNEQEILRKTVEKYCEEGANLDEKERNRLYGRLVRRGFKSADITQVLDEMNIQCIFSENR